MAADRGRVWAATERGLYQRGDQGWRRVAQLGEARFDQRRGRRRARGRGRRRQALRAAPAGAQGSTGFVEVPYHHGPPRSAALAASGLWVSDAQGLYRLGDGTNHAVAAPFRGGGLAAVGAGVLLAGKGGVWTRDGLAAAWRELSPRPARALADRRCRLPGPPGGSR